VTLIQGAVRAGVAGLLSLTAAEAAARQAAVPSVHETVVVTGTVAPEPLGNIGRAMTVLTPEDLAGLPLTSLADALRLLASVDVRERGPRGVQSDFSLRGAGFGQALVLVDGTRLNDAQSGHHNGDIPVAFDDIERIEVLHGAGASLHGADAVGGTINVITRRRAPRLTGGLAVGQHALVETALSLGLVRGERSAHVVSGELLRSSGFMPVRDHDTRLARYQATLRRHTTVSIAHLDKAFGAAGFYGPAPSREWTDQTLGRIEHRFEDARGWLGRADASYRTHGDRFLYDERTPALSENAHRTHAVTAHLRGTRTVAASTQLGVGAGGGSDWIYSTNLGEHAFARGSAFAELRQGLGSRVFVHPALRVDAYSRFGTAWSPALSVTGRATPHLRWRASTGRGFRVPTFTELFYTDPNHQASGALRPETAWSVDGGGDWVRGRWTGGFTVFRRWEQDVIDWVRASEAERWRTTNVRQVRTAGIETSIRRRFAAGGHVALEYARTTSGAPALDLLSKYVLEYARHALAASASAEWRSLSLGARLELRQRAGSRTYQVIDLRVARRFGGFSLYVDALNTFNTQYQEVRGVDMPGRWVKAGVRLR
jgi:outer membrane cobalamin receptor